MIFRVFGDQPNGDIKMKAVVWWIAFSMLFFTPAITSSQCIHQPPDEILYAEVLEKTSQYGDFVYEVNTNLNTVTIVYYTGSDSNLKVPDTIDGKPVTAIAFYKRSGIESISLPSSVTTIGNYAFRGCSLPTMACILVCYENPAL